MLELRFALFRQQPELPGRPNDIDEGDQNGDVGTLLPRRFRPTRTFPDDDIAFWESVDQS
jgi:hypothetical protein